MTNELFFPGRMAYIMDLEEETESDIPTTTIRYFGYFVYRRNGRIAYSFISPIPNGTNKIICVGFIFILFLVYCLSISLTEYLLIFMQWK